MTSSTASPITYAPQPIPAHTLAGLRSRDDAGNVMRPYLARTDGVPIESVGSPLRCCWRSVRPGDRIALVSYAPLRRWAGLTGADPGAYDEIGPIFIHARECRPYAETESFPADFAERRLVLRAYGHTGEIVDAIVAPPGTASDCAARFFEDERVAEIHVRHESYTCFDFKIVRA